MSRGIYLLSTFLALFDSGDLTPSGATVGVPYPEMPWLLLVSIAILVFSYFLLVQSVAFQKWATLNEEGAPDANSGLGLVGLACMITIGSVLAWWLLLHPPPHDRPPAENVFWLLTSRPSELAIGPLLASLVAAGVALTKFMMASFIKRGAGDISAPNRSGAGAVAGAILSVVSLIGSIATLVMFVEWMKH